MLIAKNRHWGLTGIALLGLLIAVIAVVQMFAVNGARAASGEVVLLDPTDQGFGSGTIVTKYGLAGKTVVRKTPVEWAAMTTADFASYDAIVLADPTCQVGTAAITAAIGNASTWGAAVDGNVIIIGTDEAFHQGGRGDLLMEGGSAFSVAEAGKTGAYISMSCYYNGTAPLTTQPMLDAAFGSIGDFTTTGVGCYNDAHIVATHPAFTAAGVTDAVLSSWGCSVHEAFDNWPISFEVLAIARGIGASFTAPDGSVGTPYILARGVTVISDIDLTPDGAVNNIGETHTVTAVVTVDDPLPGTPVVGTTVTFEVIAGPHIAATGTDVTDGTGSASFSYVGTAVGIDTIEATFVDGLGRTQRSNRVTKEWEDAVDTTPPVLTYFGEAVNEATGPDGAVHTYVATATDDEDPALVVVCDPASGSVFSMGDTVITCTATDASGNSVTETYLKTVVDTTAPVSNCVESVNPSGKNIPAAPGKGGQGQNQDGFYQISATDAVDPDLELYIVDDGTGTVFGPFASGSNIKYTEANGADPSIKPGSGDVDWKINGQGDAAAYAVDSSGNVGAVAVCLVPPDPK